MRITLYVRLCYTVVKKQTMYVLLTPVACRCCLNSSIVVFEMLISRNIPSSLDVNWHPHSVCKKKALFRIQIFKMGGGCLLLLILAVTKCHACPPSPLEGCSYKISTVARGHTASMECPSAITRGESSGGLMVCCQPVGFWEGCIKKEGGFS